MTIFCRHIVVQLILAFVGPIGLCERASAAPPPWADARLPVADGLAVWLDPSVQSAALAPFGIPAYITGARVEKLLDASGHDRHMLQPKKEARPAIRIDGQVATLRFNGRGEHFSLSGLNAQFDELTVFIVAAPAANAGNFRGFVSMHASGKDDFVSGLNIDQGPFTSPDFAVVNVEGAGAGGVRNLRTASAPHNEFHRLTLTSTVGPEGVVLYVDGQLEGRRERTPSSIAMDELFLGARIYGGFENARGFFNGEIAEVIIYDRVLSDEDRKAVDEYLAAKYASLTPPPPFPNPNAAGAIPRVAQPPLVQPFLPGFTARELPLELPNVNNVQYRDDGTLVALGYDGNVYHLTDTDGDGLEDHSEMFWNSQGGLRAPIGMDLTPKDYPHGRGVVVAAKSKCVLIVDRDGDDRADEEIAIADGWTELPHGVDALGVAFDPRDHAIYFGLGVQNFTNPFLVDKAGKAEFRMGGERGTILRIAPDLKSREVAATGIRFPVAVRFNAAGDLFCTDQEGATWLANGNPFDELLHVQRGRHYGFPPRHPRHLPEVIDEPSTYDYRPQHQSTCGLNFNEPTIDNTIFGPDAWRSDTIVTGYSRGKLYRTRLVKDATQNYVAQTQLFGSITMLPADACVAPNRSLVVAAHSGGPDWGSGPSGIGKLFKLEFIDATAPQPALVWTENDREVRIAFDRPVDPAQLHNVLERIAIEGGEFVAAGDRFEVQRPGYAAVEYQQDARRFGVDVHSAQLTPDRRTLILTTAPHSAAVSYAIAVKGSEDNARGRESFATGDFPDKPIPPVAKDSRPGPDLDLQYDLAGVQTTWQPVSGEQAWTGWLPHLDFGVSRAFTVGSASHDAFWKSIAVRGVLKLNTTLDLRNMLRPDVQIGSQLDHEWPAETLTIVVTASEKFELTLGDQTATSQSAADGKWSAKQAIPVSDDGQYPLQLTLAHSTGDAPPSLAVHYFTAEDSRPRPLALHRFLLPWARRSADAPKVIDNRDLPELAGGNWLRGQQEFFGPQAGCSKCHTIHGQGAKVAPDLSNLSKRDYASVVRDVTQPSFAINPDYVTQVVMTVEGRVHTGTVRTDGEELIVSDSEGKEMLIPREDVEDVRASELSIMPEGIPKTLGPDRMRDLLTFLLVAPPTMPVYGEGTPPPARTRAEVEAVLENASPARAAPLRITLVTGPKDHGPGEHDYPAWKTAWSQLLAMDENVTVDTADGWPTPEQLKSADVLVFYQQGSWTAERAVAVDRFLQRGGGLVYIHYAVDGGAEPEGFAERIGLAWKGGHSKFRHGELDVQFTGSDHPIARNFSRVHFHDESYWNLLGDPARIKLLATGIEEGAPQPLFWTAEPHAGRVFVSIPGHFSWTFDDPLFRTLLLRGIAWSARQPVDRLNALVVPGARVELAP